MGIPWEEETFSYQAEFGDQTKSLYNVDIRGDKAYVYSINNTSMCNIDICSAAPRTSTGIRMVSLDQCVSVTNYTNEVIDTDN